MRNLSKGKIIILLIVAILIGTVIWAVWDYKKQDDFFKVDEIENNDENLQYLEGTGHMEGVDIDIMPTDVEDFNNPTLAIDAGNAVKRLSGSAYSSDAMLGILDDEYLNHFNLNKDNIKDHVAKYKKSKYNIVDMKLARYGSKFIVVITCDNESKFVYKYDEIHQTYTMLLDDYINDIGYDKFISEKLELLINEIPKGSPYTITESHLFSGDEILLYYRSLINDFDDLYNNYLTNETKEKYSYDKLAEIFNNKYSMLGIDFKAVAYTVTPNEYGHSDYSFKDSSGNRYVLSEHSYFKFDIKIEI